MKLTDSSRTLMDLLETIYSVPKKWALMGGARVWLGSETFGITRRNFFFNYKGGGNLFEKDTHPTYISHLPHSQVGSHAPKEDPGMCHLAPAKSSMDRCLQRKMKLKSL